MRHVKSSVLTGAALALCLNAGCAFAQSVSIDNFHAVADGRVYRSGKPTAAQIAELAALGVKTVLSLETYRLDPDDADEERAAAEAAGITFLRIPMSPLPFDEPAVADIQAAVDVLRDPNRQPVLVHCYHGSDRTGIVIGAYRIEADGWSASAAIAEMPQYGHSWLFSGWDHILYQF